MRAEHLSAIRPEFRQEADLPLAPTLYEMEVSINPASYSYSGTLKLTFWNHSPQPMPQVMLRTYPDFFQNLGGGLNLYDVRLNNQPAQVQEQASTYRMVRGVGPVAGCSRATLSLGFEGRLGRQLRTDAYAIGTFWAGQSYFALGTFYPQLGLWEKLPDKPGWDWTVTPMRASSDLTAAESAYYDVRLLAPASYGVFGSGVEAPTGEALAATGLRAWRFVGGPLREFAAVGGESYRSPPLTATTESGISVKVYTVATGDALLQTRQADFARKALDVTVATLDEFGSAVTPYPYSQFTLVQFPIAGFNGIEWPMFSQFSFELFRNSYAGQESEFGGLKYSKPGTQVIVHEVLHQWWYNLVGNDQQSEPFVDEGLTEYSVYLLAELRARRAHGPVEEAREFGRGWLDRLRKQILEADLPTFGDLKAGSAASEVSLAQAGFIYYRKMPLLYEAYRQKFGDAAFFGFLKSYTTRYRFKLVHAADLSEALVAAAPGREREVRAFLERWLSGKTLAADLGK